MCPHDLQCWCAAAADVADQMPYVDAVIKETIRLYDPATVLFRRALEDILVDGNLVIPKVRVSSHCATAMQLFTDWARGEGGWDKKYTALLLPPHMLSPHLRSLNSHAHDWIKSMVGSTTATDVFQQARSVSSKAARFQPSCILCQGYRPSQCQCLQGWTIQLHLAGSQRNIKSFEANASEFKPERFLSTDNKLHR